VVSEIKKNYTEVLKKFERRECSWNQEKAKKTENYIELGTKKEIQKCKKKLIEDEEAVKYSIRNDSSQCSIQCKKGES
jgi:hypothetical protein